MIATLVLTIYCVACGIYLFRLLSTPIHLMLWAALGSGVLGFGIWVAATAAPSDTCYWG